MANSSRKRSKSHDTVSLDDGARNSYTMENDEDDESKTNRHPMIRGRANTDIDILPLLPLLANNVMDPDDDNDDDNNSKKLIASLQIKISALEYNLEETQRDYNEIESKYQLCSQQNQMLREAEMKYNNKCIEYDKLNANYDKLKIELLNIQKSSKLNIDHIGDLQIQKDEIMARYDEIEKENIEYQEEINELRQIHRSYHSDLLSLNDAVNDSQRELRSIKTTKNEDNINAFNNFMAEIRKLNQKISDLNKENEKLKEMNNLYSTPPDRDRDSFDENDNENDNENENDNDIGYNRQKAPRSRSHSKSSGGSPHGSSATNTPIWSQNDSLIITQRRRTHNFTSHDMEYLTNNIMNVVTTPNISAADDDDHVIAEITDSLWHDIDIQIIKIESLLTMNETHLLDINRSHDIEEEKSLEYNIDDDVDKLPQRLQIIYNELEILYDKYVDEINVDEKEKDIKQRYESIISLNNIKINNLQNKVKEIKTQKSVLMDNLNSLQSLYNGYKIQTRIYLNRYKNRIETMNKMIKLRYWQQQIRKYGISLIIILFIMYYLYKEKEKRRFRIRRAIRTFFA